MAKNNSQEYWRERAKEVIDEESKNDYEIIKEVERIINEMNDDIEKEVLKFYAKYATAEGISLKDAKKKIDTFDVQSFKDKAKQYVKEKDFSDKANKELKEVYRKAKAFDAIVDIEDDFVKYHGFYPCVEEYAEEVEEIISEYLERADDER